MNAVDLIRQLENLGVKLWEEEGKLHFRGPKGTITEAWRAQLAAQKGPLIAELRAAAAPIVADPKSRHEPFPLTDVQASYLLGRKRSFLYGGIGCHAYGELALEQVDPERLTMAWRYLIRRHDMLRAVILPDGSQQVLPDVPDFQVKVTDLRGLDGKSVERALDATRAGMSHRVYDPAIWPLFDLRMRLINCGARLHFSVDFLVADYVSIFVVLSELKKKYDRPDVELPDLLLSFRDYMLWSKSSRSGAAYERDRTYWLNRIDDFPLAPELPITESLPAADQLVRFRRWDIALEPETWNALQRAATTYGLTSSGAVLAAYAEIIGRWSRHQRFALDLTLLSRPMLHPEAASIVGDFTSVSLLEVDHRRMAPFSERARHLQQQLARDMDHSRFTGIEMIRELARRRNPREALMPVVFTSALGLNSSGEMPMGQFIGGISQTPQVWIDCQVMERGGGLAINWDVRDGVFPDGLIDTLFASFESLLRRISSDTAVWSSVCPVPLPTEQWKRRAAENEVVTSIPQETLFSGALAWARRDPQRSCILAMDGSFTYGEIFCRASAVKTILDSSGVKPGDIVAVHMEKGAMQIVAVLAILMAGAAYLPIEIDEAPVRRNEILLAAGVRVALCSGIVDIPDSIRQILPASVGLSQSIPQAARIAFDALAYVIFTSGSTGKPKGVMVTHQSALNTLHDVNARFQIGAEDKILGLSNLAFDLSVYDIFGTLNVGGTLVLPAHGRRADPSHWADLITRHRVTVWNSVPSLMEMLRDYLVVRPETDITSLRRVLLSGDRISLDLAKWVRGLSPAMQGFALGGATEASIWSIFFPLSKFDRDGQFVPYGRALGNQDMHVLDEALRPCPDAVVGEIYIGGVGLALGYFGDDATTRERFVADPWGDGRLYRTGDLGRYLADGNIEILGREDAQVKIRGNRVELGEVESALAQHPLVARAAVTLAGKVPDRRRLLAFVEAQPVAPDAEVQLVGKVRQAVASLSGEVNLDNYLDYAQALDWAALGAIMDTFRGAGLFIAGGAHVGREIGGALAIAPRYERLVRRWLRTAVDRGVLSCGDGVYRSTPLGDRLNTIDAWNSVSAVSNSYDSPTLLSYFRESGENLAAIISGDRSALELLYPQGRADISVSMHEHSLLNRWGNRVAAAIVETVNSQRNTGHSLRVLEIGGGVGGTTASILDVIAQPAEYWFTDITQYFLNAARERFGQNPSIRFALYDVNRDFRQQGLAANYFDLIVAGDTLHVSRNVPRLLSDLREMLMPGGWLVALEMTRDHSQIMTSLEILNVSDTGLAYEDGREERDQTFFGRDEWLQLFKQSQANAVEVFPEPDDKSAEIGLSAFAVRYKTDRASLHTSELEDFMRARVPQYMIPAEIHIIDRIPLTQNGKVDRKRLADWEMPQSAGGVQVEFSSDLVKRLADIWWPVLGGVAGASDTDFFAAGGDSLLAAQLTGRIIEELPEASGIFFDDLLRWILGGPSLFELAQRISETGAEAIESAPAESQTALIFHGGATDRPTCLFVHDANGNQAFVQGLAPFLTGQVKLFELPVRPTQGSLAELAAEYHALLRVQDVSVDVLVGSGGGILLAVELARQMLEGGLAPGLTITVLGDHKLDLDSGEPIPLYAGDLDLIRIEGNEGGENFWRAHCLGEVRIFDLGSNEPGRLAQLILESASI